MSGAAGSSVLALGAGGSIVLVLLVTALVGLATLAARALRARISLFEAGAAIALALIAAGPRLAGPDLCMVPPGPGTVPGAATAPRDNPYLVLNDALNQLLPWEHAVREGFAAGHPPLWSFALEGGSSPWANPQAQVLSPVAMLARFFPLEQFFLAGWIFKVAIGFTGSLVLARLLGLPRPARLLAAASFVLAGGVAPWALFPITSTVVWVPWLAAALLRAVRRRGPGPVLLLALALAALLVSCHPETALFGFLFAATLALAARRKSAPLARQLPRVALAGLAGLLLAAPCVLPFLHLLARSERVADTMHAAQAAAAWHPATGFFTPGFLAFLEAPLGPEVFGRPYRDPFRGPFNWPEACAGYAGLAAFAGALLWIARPSRRFVPAAGFAFATFLIVARFEPLLWLLRLAPPLRAVAWARLLSVAVLALALVGAAGWQTAFRRRENAGRRATVFLAGAVSGLALTHTPWTVVVWALLGSALAATTLARRRGLAATLLALAIAVDLVPWSWLFLPAAPRSMFYPVSPFLAEASGLAREAGPVRVAGEEYEMYPSLASMYGLAEVRTHNPLAPAEYLNLLDRAFGFRPSTTRYFAPFHRYASPFLDFLGVRYLFGHVSFQQPKRFAVRAGPAPDGTILLENATAIPLAFFPGKVTPVPDAAAGEWIDGLRHPGNVVVDATTRIEPALLTASGGEVRRIALAPNGVDVEYSSPRKALLATSFEDFDSWSAGISGRPLGTVPVNGIFLGVVVPAGRGTVHLRSVPPGFDLGCAAFVAGVALLVLLGRGARPSGGAF